MAVPQPTYYACPPGRKLAGGRVIHPHACLDLIAATSQGAWVKLNTNVFSAAWPPVELRSTGTAKILSAWPSFAWDHKRHRLWIFGGGHANYSGSEIYMWDALTRKWALAYHGTALANIGVPQSSSTMALIGALQSPVAAHTYDNQLWLERLDRFLTWGGAAVGDGGPFRLARKISDSPTTYEYLRDIPGYTLQLDIAGQEFVAGPTGSNRKSGAYSNVDLPGAKAWHPLDYNAMANSAFSGSSRTVNGCGDSFIIDDVDVVFQTFVTSTSRFLRRIKMPSLDVQTHDVKLVGSPVGSSTYGSGCYVQHKDIFVINGRSNSSVVLQFWRDVASRSNAASAVDVTLSGLTGSGKAFLEAYMPTVSSFRWGMDYDPVRKMIVCWNDTHTQPLLGITPPSGTPVSAAGWRVDILNDGSDSPASHQYSGRVCGKWRYAPDMDCFIGLHDRDYGNVYAWKPFGWIDPRG